MHTIDQVRDLVRSDKEKSWDHLAAPEDLEFDSGRLQVRNGSLRSLELERWATIQLCQHLKIPYSYFRRCPVELQDRQVNHWLRLLTDKANRSRWMLRCHENRVRGIVSERYQPFDNDQLLDVLEPLLRHFQVQWFELTAESFHLRLVNPLQKTQLLKDDTIMAGIHVANSQVGKRSVTVNALVFRLVCTNGLVKLVNGASLLRLRHMVRPEQTRADLAGAIAEAERASIRAVGEFAGSASATLDDIEAKLEELAERWLLSRAFIERVREALRRESSQVQHSLYGLVNGLTRAAQELKPDERYRIEVLAGEILTREMSAQRRALPAAIA